jgi:hypothetical protein
MIIQNGRSLRWEGHVKQASVLDDEGCNTLYP